MTDNTTPEKPMKYKDLIEIVQRVEQQQIEDLTMEVNKWKVDLKRDTGLSYMKLHYEWAQCQVSKMEKQIDSLKADLLRLSVEYYFAE